MIPSALLLLVTILTPQDEAAARFAAAKRCEAAGDFACAEREYERATKLAPSSAEGFNNLGVVRNRLGKTAGAVAAFSRAVEIDPRLFGAHLNLAIAYFRLQRFRDAELPIRRALSLVPDNDQAARLLILTFFAQDKYSEVTTFAEKLLTSQPDDAGLLEVAGRAYLKLRLYAKAAHVLGRRAKLQPESAAVRLLLGEARDNLHDIEGAIEEFQRAIALSASAPLPDAHFALGYALWKLRRYAEAEGEFRRELERDNSHARSIYYLGNIALSRRDFQAALPLLERAKELMPQDFTARYDLGKALLQKGDIERAASELQTAVKLNSQHSGAYYQFAQALRRLKREDEAQRAFARASELNKAEREDLERKVQGEETKKRTRSMQ